MVRRIALKFGGLQHRRASSVEKSEEAPYGGKAKSTVKQKSIVKQRDLEHIAAHQCRYLFVKGPLSKPSTRNRRLHKNCGLWALPDGKPGGTGVLVAE